MHTLLKRKLVIGTITVATAAFAGGAYAATQNSSNPRQAFLNDVAKRLNVSPQQLTAAMKGAFLDQLDAAVKAGKLTQAQADAIKRHVQQGGAPPVGPMWFGPGPGPGPGPGAGPGPGPGFGHHFGGHAGPMAAAASYLGITEQQLFDQLASGKSLAQIASQRGKSVSGLKAAMTASLKSRLDKLVAAKMITSAQETKALSEFTAHLDDIINHTGRFGPHGGGHFGPGGPAGPGPRFHGMFGGGQVPPAGAAAGPFA
jgi:hypothetical protein